MASLAGPTAVGCNQSAEFIGTLALQPGDTHDGGAPLSFASEVDDDASTLRVWVDDYLVLDLNAGSGGGGGGGGGGGVQTAKIWYSAARDGVVCCVSDGCDQTQKASGYAQPPA